MLRKLSILFMAAAVLYMGGEGVHKFFKGRVSQSWPSVEGVILSSQVEKYETTVGEYVTDVTRYRPLIQFQYQVGDEVYEGGRFRLIKANSIEAAGAQVVVGRYPASARVLVYYNPEDPADSLLEHPYLKGIVLGYGLIVLILGGALLLMIKIDPDKWDFLLRWI